jgi:hypothetical protein
MCGYESATLMRHVDRFTNNFKHDAHLDQMQHAPINNSAPYRLYKFGMRNAPEVVREVGVNDFRVATKQLLFHFDHRLLSVSPGTVGVLFWWKVGFKDRFQYQHRCCHTDSIAQG